MNFSHSDFYCDSGTFRKTYISVLELTTSSVLINIFSDNKYFSERKTETRKFCIIKWN